MIRPFGVLLLAALLYLAAQATALTLFFQLSYILIGVVGFALFWSAINLFGWQFSRETTAQRAAVGETVRERIELRNRWWLPRLWLEVTDESRLPGRSLGFVAAPARRGSERWSAATVCVERGRYAFGPTRLTASDPFGLIRFSRLLPAGGTLLVYPFRSELPPITLPGSSLTGALTARRNAYQRSPSIAGIREYVPGDGLSRIHWRSSARYNRLMVKEFEQDPTADVMIVLDLQTRWYAAAAQPAELLAGVDVRRISAAELGARLSDGDTAERSISLAASLADQLLQRGLAVGLTCWGREHQVLTPERGAVQLSRVLELLAALEPRSPNTLADVLTSAHTRWNSGTTVIVITAAADVSWLAPLEHLRERGIPALAYLVDRGSYDGASQLQPVIDELTARGIPSALVRRGAAPQTVAPI